MWFRLSFEKIRLDAMKKVVKAAHRKKIDTFVTVGVSGKPVSLLFKHMWKQLYPKQAVPKMISLGRFIRRENTLKLSSDPNVVQKLFEHRPILKERVGGRIMLFEEFSVTGSTNRLAKSIFKKAGAKKLTTAALVSQKTWVLPSSLPGEDSLFRIKKVADVIGAVNKNSRVLENVSLYKRRALLTMGGKSPAAKRAHRRLKNVRTGLASSARRARK